MAGARHELSTLFGVGGTIASVLYVTGAWAWTWQLQDAERTVDPEYDAPIVIPVMASIAGIAFVVMFWFSMFDYKLIHHGAFFLGFATMSTWGGFLCGVTQSAENSDISRMKIVRWVFYGGMEAAVLLLDHFTRSVRKMKATTEARTSSEVCTDTKEGCTCDTLAPGKTPDIDVESDKAEGKQKEYQVDSQTVKPWDSQMRYAALVEYTCFVFFAGLLLSTSNEFLSN